MLGLKNALVIGGAVATGFAGSANAAELLDYVAAAQYTLSQYNLVVYGDVDSTSEAEGRTFIGGNLKGASSNWNINGVTGGEAGLTVVGNLTGNAKQAKGAIKIGGNAETQINNGSSLQIGGTSVGQNGSYAANLGSSFTQGLIDQRNSITSSLNAFSSVLSTLTATAGSSFSNGTFATGGAANVINISTADLNNLSNANISVGGGTTIINVSGKNLSLASSINFNGGEGIASKVIWNFYEADTIDFGSKKWYGTVLAPKAEGHNGNYILGSAVFSSLLSRGEFHIPSASSNFDGDLTGFTPLTKPPVVHGAVPEPATWAMMIAGFGLVGGAMRRRPTAEKLAA
jgi:choice-of-anchor A domain-containing protein